MIHSNLEPLSVNSFNLNQRSRRHRHVLSYYTLLLPFYICSILLPSPCIVYARPSAKNTHPADDTMSSSINNNYFSSHSHDSFETFLADYTQTYGVAPLASEPSQVPTPPNNIPAPRDHPTHPGKSWYFRDAGDIPTLTCHHDEDQENFLCFQKCKTGFVGFGSACIEKCQPDESDLQFACASHDAKPTKRTKITYTRGTGRLADQNCPAAKSDLDAGICHLPCEEGWKGVMFLCFYVPSLHPYHPNTSPSSDLNSNTASTSNSTANTPAPSSLQHSHSDGKYPVYTIKSLNGAPNSDDPPQSAYPSDTVSRDHSHLLAGSDYQPPRPASP